ncbi:MAG: MCE family protein [Mycobacterium sp.]
MSMKTVALAPIKRLRGRPLESYSPFWVGLTAIALVAVVAGSLLAVRASGVGYLRYTAEFAQAAQLRSGDNVTIAGVHVGEVDDVQLAGNKILVAMRVRDNVDLGDQTHAAIKLTTLLGSRYVELRPAGTGRLDHRRIGMSYTEVPYDLQSLLADATTTVEELDVNRMVTALGRLSGQLDGLPEALPQAMSNLKQLSGVIADRRGQIGEMLQGAATITSTLHRQQAALGQLVYQGRDLLGEFVSRRASFHKMMASVTSLVALMGEIVGPDRAAFESLLANLQKLTAMFSDHDDLFRNLLQVMPIPLRSIANGTGSAPALEFNFSAGIMIDDWLCAISGRAKQFNLTEYFKDCA